MKERAAAVVVTFTTAAALAALCVRGVFLRWFADDYWVAACVAGRGFWRGQAQWYQIGSGRFTFTFIEAVLAFIRPWTLMLLVPLTTFAMAGALHARLRWPLALAMAWAILLGTSDVPQSVLWETGLLSYAAPLAAFVWWISSASRRTEWRWFDAVVPLAAAGCSETEALAQIAVCAIAFVAWRRKPALAGLIGSLLCLGVMIPSPGNAIRKGLYPPTPPLPHVIAATTTDAVSFFADAITRSGTMLILVFLAAALFAPRLPGRVAVVAALCTIACVFITFAACEVTLGVALPQRARMLAYALLLATIAASAAAIPRLDRWRSSLAVLLIVVATLPLITAVQLAREIPEARTFVQRWDRLDTFLRANRGRTVFIDNAPGTVGTLPFIEHDPAFNVMIAGTYGLKSVVATPLYRNGRMVVAPPPKDAVRYRWE